jgi:CubicO group peptidase (beta-lactamase class C family)
MPVVLSGAAAPQLAFVVDFIHHEIEAGTFPGACLLVYHRGQCVVHYFEGHYCSETARKSALHRDVSHMLYSFSKGVSATVVAIARQKNLIDYDAPLHRYIPGYRAGGRMKRPFDICLITRRAFQIAG